MENNNYLTTAQSHLSQGRVQDCLNVLKKNINSNDSLTQVLQLEIRHNNLKRKINTGTIDSEDAQLEENKISSSLLSIMANLSNGSDSSPFPKTSRSIDPKWFIIGLLTLSLLGLGYYVLSDGGNQSPDPCHNISCLNNGKCVNGTCDCPSGYMGDRCQTKVEVADPCKNINCLNGGCQTKVEVADLCKNINCLNGGICRDGACDCPSGYTGTRCQTKLSPNTFLDSRDNKSYKIKKIGSKYWMMENMRYKVPGSKCKNCITKGRHYNLAMAKKACPSGWTLPSVSDFKELLQKGGSFNGAVQLAKIDFNGRYGRSGNGNDFAGVGTFASFWTSSSQGQNGSHFFFNKKNNINITRADVQGNDQMYSCRCVKRN